MILSIIWINIMEDRMVLKNSKSPLYYQLAEIILSEIESKNLKESTVRNIN